MRWSTIISMHASVARNRAISGARKKKSLWRAVDGILLLDKPLGLSSNGALQAVRRLFNAEKAGHTGNLDPRATGMLPVCFGEATKLSGRLLDADKRYVAIARFGACTATGDAEGEVVATSDVGGLDWAALEAVRAAFAGTISQTPPMYSAIKHEGRRLYELARNGQTVARTARQVRIHELRWRPLSATELEISVACSKGTYIRTLVEDLAAGIGHCAHLRQLRRLEVHPFGGQPMWTVDALQALAEAGDLDRALLPMNAAVRDWLQVDLPREDLVRVARGQTIAAPAALTGQATDTVAVIDEFGSLRALARLDPVKGLVPSRWLGGARWLEANGSES